MHPCAAARHKPAAVGRKVKGCRESIVTAPGPGSPVEVRVFAFSLLKPITEADHGTDASRWWRLGVPMLDIGDFRRPRVTRFLPVRYGRRGK
jgi:hypothetical protein